MTNPTRSTTLLPAISHGAPLARLGLSGGFGGPVASHATTRPGLIETLFASRSERRILREREAAAVTVESVQIAAAVELAVLHVEDHKSLALKARRAETARSHYEQEDQMQRDCHDAEASDTNNGVSRALEVLQDEKKGLDTAKALVSSGRIAPDRAEFLESFVRSGSEDVLRSDMRLREMIKESREALLNRALSRKP